MQSKRIDVSEGVRIHLRTLSAGNSCEYYISALLEDCCTSLDVSGQADLVYTAIASILNDGQARILNERIFASLDAFEAIDKVRSRLLSEWNDGIPATRLVEPSLTAPSLCSVQIHAVRAPAPIEVLNFEDGARARQLTMDGCTWTYLNEVSGGANGSERDRALRMFRTASERLAIAGCDFESVARTWLWLGDICSWYEDFNLARNQFFNDCGLMNNKVGAKGFPASTGIGVQAYAEQTLCAMDLIAITGADDVSQNYGADGEQPEAFGYGAAFSRATLAKTPGGRTLLVSGTAAIDPNGISEHDNEPQAQIEATLAHVRALLSSRRCKEEELLSSIAYCKDDEIRRAFLKTDAGKSWPGPTVIGPICRAELLFEVEVTAAAEGQFSKLS